jgi:chromosome segregation ATPase
VNATKTERDALMSRIASLQDELEDIDERRANIKDQIERAQANRITTGEYADPDWFRRAKAALRHLGVERNEVTRDLGEANRRLREVNSSHNIDTFYLATREVVDDATWERIVAHHQHLLANGGAS